MKKILILMFGMFLLFGCSNNTETEKTEKKILTPSEKITNSNSNLTIDDFTENNIHYKIISQYKGGVVVINVTLDSLKIINLQKPK